MTARSISRLTLAAAATLTGAASLFGVLVLVGTPSAPAHAAGVYDHDFVGAERCRSCHTAAYDTWKRGPHARAFDALSKADQKDPTCLTCHTTVPSDLSPQLTAVQCETCHGAGRYYTAEYVMRDEVLRAELNLVTPNEKTCARCHTESTPSLTPFDYSAALERIRHWPAAEKTAAKPTDN